MIEAWDQDVEQRLSSAVKSKLAGGEHFQQQEYKKAGEYYIQALKHLIPILRSTPEERNIADGLMIACYSNLAGGVFCGLFSLVKMCNQLRIYSEIDTIHFTIPFGNSKRTLLEQSYIYPGNKRWIGRRS